MSDESSQGAEKADGKKVGMGCLVVVALVIGLPAACVGVLSARGGDDWEPTAVEARLICEDWVRAKLKAPSTADFTDGDTRGAGTGPYVVTGSVDAENSFGASLRSQWTCDIRYDEDSQQWRGSASLLD